LKTYEQLSKNEIYQLLEVVESNLDCNNENDLKKNILKLQNLFNFDHIVCAYGNPLRSFHLILGEYPYDFLQRYIDKKYYLVDHVMQDYFNTLKLQNWIECDTRHSDPLIVDIEAEACGLKDGFTCGVKHDDNNKTTISFAGSTSTIENTERTRQIIELINPHFSETIIKLSAPQIAKKRYNLTPREKEILNWLKDGKTSWEISNILLISKRTVDFHADNIIQKLDAMNRTHAVAKAIYYKIIKL